MALIKCPECGNVVSDKAEKCPKCGAEVSLFNELEKEKRKKNLRIIFGCLIVLFLIICGLGIKHYLGSNGTVGNRSNTSGKNATDWIDVREINNSQPFIRVAWNVDWDCSFFDGWFSETPGLITDNATWLEGTRYAQGRFTYHRFNKAGQYTCNFSDKYKGCDDDCYGARVAYGRGVRDEAMSNLPRTRINGNQYYVLDLTEWEDWCPLYLPYSTTIIKDRFGAGQLMVCLTSQPDPSVKQNLPSSDQTNTESNPLSLKEKIAKIRVGMTERDVIDILGQPKERVEFIDGAGYRHLYYGNYDYDVRLYEGRVKDILDLNE